MTRNSNDDQSVSRHYPWALFVSGATASGKTTIAKFLASQLDARLVEGDDFHPKANVEKMHKGEPLNDSDRQGWLEALSRHTLNSAQESGSHRLVVSCSALKRGYRDTLRGICQERGGLEVRFLFLDAPESVLQQRANRRTGHFADPHLVATQFDALERPGIDEQDTAMVSVVPPLEDVKRAAFAVVSEVL